MFFCAEEQICLNLNFRNVKMRKKRRTFSFVSPPSVLKLSWHPFNAFIEDYNYMVSFTPNSNIKSSKILHLWLTSPSPVLEVSLPRNPPFKNYCWCNSIITDLFLKFEFSNCSKAISQVFFKIMFSKILENFDLYTLYHS